MDNNICITGLGIICSIGNDAASVLDSLREGRPGIGSIKYLETRHSHLPVGEVQLSDDQMKEILGIEGSEPMSRTSLMGAIAVRQALEQAGITDISGKRVALISGTTVGGMDLTEKYFERMKTDDSLLYLPQSNECGLRIRCIGDIVANQHTALDIQNGCKIHSLSNRWIVVFLDHDIKGIVIHHPDAVCMDPVMHSLCMRNTVIVHRLVSASCIFQHRKGDGLDLPPEAPFGRVLAHQLRMLLSNVGNCRAITL